MIELTENLKNLISAIFNDEISIAETCELHEKLNDFEKKTYSYFQDFKKYLKDILESCNLEMIIQKK